MPRTRLTSYSLSATSLSRTISFGAPLLLSCFLHLCSLRDRFTVNLDPNGNQGMGIPWPRYDTQNRRSMMFQDSSLFPLRVVKDDYREAPLDFIANLSLIHPI